MTPNCPRSKKTNFSTYSNQQNGNNGYFIYCSDCGAVISWAPDLNTIHNSIKYIETKINHLK